MPTDKELMQQALDVLSCFVEYDFKGNPINIQSMEAHNMMQALRARLAGWERVNMNDHKEGDLGIGTVQWDASSPLVVHPHPAFQATQPDLAKVGEVGVWGERQWQGLTDEECLQNPYCAGENDAEVIQLARAIEAKLKEKNHG